MRLASLSCVLVAAIVGFTAGCSGGGAAKIQGPLLSLDGAKSIVIDQFYASGGTADEYASLGDFSVYLRDAATGKDIVCSRKSDGMSEVAVAGLYYGGLSIPFVEVEGEHPSSLARFEVVFVEKNSDGCPKGIDSADTIVGISQEFSFDNLLGKRIWAADGRAAAVFRAPSDEAASVSSMAPAAADGLAIDKLYFDDGSDSQKPQTYYIFAYRTGENGSSYECQIADALMKQVRYDRIIYSSLDFPFSCFDATNPNFASMNVRVGLYVQRDSGPELVGETEARAIGDLIGEKVSFTNEQGYVTFRGVVPAAFSSSVVRLSDLAKLAATALDYGNKPSASPTVELEITDVNGAYAIACAGASQRLSGVGAPGSYDSLNAGFVAAGGQKELFGWDKVVIRLVDRTDGLACPQPLASEPTVLAETAPLASGDIAGKHIPFSNGAGSVTVALSAGK